MTEDQIICEHAEHVRAFALSLGYFIPGADVDDLQQEALIGLLSAVRSYKPERGPFVPFALGCVRRRLIECLRAAHRYQRRPLNESLRIGTGEDDEEIALVEALEDPRADVHAQFIAHEMLNELLSNTELSSLERSAVFGTAFGYSYFDLGPHKQVDNAAQRGLRKLRSAA